MHDLVEVELGEAGQLGAPHDQNCWVECCVEVHHSVVGDEEEDQVDVLVDVLFSVDCSVQEHNTSKHCEMCDELNY